MSICYVPELWRNYNTYKNNSDTIGEPPAGCPYQMHSSPLNFEEWPQFLEDCILSTKISIFDYTASMVSATKKILLMAIPKLTITFPQKPTNKFYLGFWVLNGWRKFTVLIFSQKVSLKCQKSATNFLHNQDSRRRVSEVSSSHAHFKQIFYYGWTTGKQSFFFLPTPIKKITPLTERRCTVMKPDKKSSAAVEKTPVVQLLLL